MSDIRDTLQPLPASLNENCATQHLQNEYSDYSRCVGMQPSKTENLENTDSVTMKNGDRVTTTGDNGHGFKIVDKDGNPVTVKDVHVGFSSQQPTDYYMSNGAVVSVGGGAPSIGIYYPDGDHASLDSKSFIRF